MFKKKVDAKWYLATNPDVGNSGMSAEEHYHSFGKAEGRRPSPPGLVERLCIRSRVIVEALHLLASQQGGYLAMASYLNETRKTQGMAGVKHLILRTHNESKINKTAISYQDWIVQNELGSADFEQAVAEIQTMRLQPLISIIVPTYQSNLVWLQEAIDSVKNQPYTNWQLCFADDASPNPAVAEFLAQQAALDARIKFTVRATNGHISDASNSAVELASGEWLALFDHDDLLHPFALYWVVKAMNTHPDAALIYSDEDKTDEKGNRHSPYFKSDWNYDLFLSQNCFSHLGLIRKDLFNEIGGFRKGYEGSQDHDLILRAAEHVNPEQIVHIPKVLYHWRVHAESTAGSANSKPYAAIAGEKAIADHLARQGADAEVSFEGYGYRVKYALPVPLPLVSLIIPTRNGLTLLRQCIESIQNKTLYSNYEFIIVDNGSDDLDALTYLNRLRSKPGFTVIRDTRPFNYSQLNNLAVSKAKGELVALINNDIEVISPEWLGEMVVQALRPGVGVVGAKLLYPDNRLQHGGVILGIGGVANHSHLFINRNDHGYFARASVVQRYSAVTAACLVVRKSIYDEVNGLDEKNLVVAFNDVDFCIRVGKQGYRNIWTPYALLYHHESATRGHDIAPEKYARFVGEVNYMMDTWKKELLSDPYYNPNLNLDFPDFTLHKTPRMDKWALTIPLADEAEPRDSV
ncbi:glycosyltransferase family 2 protein [Cellvibrio polysaccharolyticus]|uniref:Glycosyltransferase family 2 protein n=1 Tax=Cellvibrio polysaccharolyticus TaxID=2082724 RepID=A0A928V404_9GAMM|nr:glycosyltransferase family 2 protein [Cellvibrio polysaccharolyticus]MBE8718358.1 glycosyltransferase family 2 protein [Cellvibrio polysaccharolyticus]